MLVLKLFQITGYQGNLMGVGYFDKLRWAIYSPTTGKVGHGTLGSAPESEQLAGGFGYNFSPFFQPGVGVVGYCLRLSDWWREVDKKRKEDMGQVHQIGSDINDVLAQSVPVQRCHRLISEASPEAPPSGYFDCTVEARDQILISDL